MNETEINLFENISLSSNYTLNAKKKEIFYSSENIKSWRLKNKSKWKNRRNFIKSLIKFWEICREARILKWCYKLGNFEKIWCQIVFRSIVRLD